MSASNLERQLPKLDVAGSIPVSRSIPSNPHKHCVNTRYFEDHRENQITQIARSSQCYCVISHCFWYPFGIQALLFTARVVARTAMLSFVPWSSQCFRGTASCEFPLPFVRIFCPTRIANSKRNLEVRLHQRIVCTHHFQMFRGLVISMRDRPCVESQKP